MKMICIAALVLFAGAANAQLFDQVDEGYYRVQRPDGTLLPEKFAKQSRALVAAVAEANRCKCAVHIIPPKQRVTVTGAVVEPPKPTRVVFHWTLPTKRENGAALAVTDLKDCTVYVTGAATATGSAAAPATSVSIELMPGEYSAAASCTDKGNLSSKLSTIINFSV